MKPIVVTGAAGTLGGGVTRKLAERGVAVRAVDFERPNLDLDGVECVAADTSDHSTALEVAEGAQSILHLGAYHGVHLPRNDGAKSERDFFDANVGGTFNMLSAAAEHGIAKVTWASSVVVYERGTWRLFGIYSLSKVLGEEICAYYNREHGVRVIGLRYGTFGFGSFLDQGFGMLGGLAHGNVIFVEDVVDGTIAAAENDRIDFGMYDLQTPLPFTPEEEWEYLRGSRIEMLSKRWPQHTALFERFEHMLPREIKSVRMHRTLSDLGMTVRHDFPWFLDELARRIDAGESLE